MRKILSAILIISSVIGLITTSNAQLSNNKRRAVVLEAFYALSPSHDGGGSKTINGNLVSNWNYLANDTDKYNKMKGLYGCPNSSVWAVQGLDSNKCVSYAEYKQASFYSQIEIYGYGTEGGKYGDVGRGGECKFFANLILYRSGADGDTFPSYSIMSKNVEKDLTKAVEGDVLFNPTAPHTAIVVEIKRDSKHNVTGLDVIDSNFITDIPNKADREVIGRHLFQLSSIKGKYLIWKGVDYYKEPYNP